MARARKQARQRRRAESLLGSMRKFLTPEVFKQVRNAANRRKSPRWGCENEGFFRIYKRTLKKATLMGRTAAQVHREAETSMIAAQLLLCQGVMAMRAVAKNGLPVMCSPRRVLLEARHDISARKEPTEPFAERITRAEREQRIRPVAKEKREWPRRKPHTAPHPPILLKLTDEQKLIIHNQLQAA